MNVKTAFSMMAFLVFIIFRPVIFNNINYDQAFTYWLMASFVTALLVISPKYATIVVVIDVLNNVFLLSRINFQ